MNLRQISATATAALAIPAWWTVSLPDNASTLANQLHLQATITRSAPSDWIALAMVLLGAAVTVGARRRALRTLGAGAMAAALAWAAARTPKVGDLPDQTLGAALPQRVTDTLQAQLQAALQTRPSTTVLLGLLAAAVAVVSSLTDDPHADPTAAPERALVDPLEAESRQAHTTTAAPGTYSQSPW